jgi:RNA polymerase sigma-70 factor (ECF subfamily)
LLHDRLLADPVELADRPSASQSWGTRERSAFETIMRRHGRLVYRAARSIVEDDAAAQRLVKEVFLWAFGNFHLYRGQVALGTWLARIAIRTVRGRRALHDAFEWSERWEREKRKNGSWVGCEAHGPECNSRHDQDGTAQVARLQSAIERLRSCSRIAFVLRVAEGIDPAETAYVLEVSNVLADRYHEEATSSVCAEVGDAFAMQVRCLYPFTGERCDAIVQQVLTEVSRQALSAC